MALRVSGPGSLSRSGYTGPQPGPDPINRCCHRLAGIPQEASGPHPGLDDRRAFSPQARIGPGDSDPIEAAEWTTYVRYRELLARLGAEDDAGISVWASKYLVRGDRPGARARSNPPESWTFLEYEGSTPAHLRVLEHALRRGGPVQVALTCESDPAVGEVYLAAAAVRARLLDQGFVETEMSCPGERPAGLRSMEHVLFRDSPGSEPTVSDPQGLAVFGVPQGEGMGRLVARQVRDLLRAGVPGEEILILFRNWSEQADLVVEVLRSWGLNAHADEPGSLQTEPAVSALRMAARLPLQEWETEQVVRLLRNGQVRPAWPNCDRLALASAASVIKATSAFRGRQQLLRELDRALQQPRDQRTPPNGSGRPANSLNSSSTCWARWSKREHGQTRSLSFARLPGIWGWTRPARHPSTRSGIPLTITPLSWTVWNGETSW